MQESDPRAGALGAEIFARETAMCRKLKGEKGGCNWGRCEDCGVIPLLVKLHTGRLLETPEEVGAAKEEILGE